MGIPYFLNDGVLDDTEMKIIKKKANKMQVEIDNLKAIDLSTHVNNISNNTSNISSNNAAILTNSNNISNNTSNISSNNAAILTNATNISINTGSISTHSGSISNIIQDITNLQSQDGTVLKLETFNVTITTPVTDAIYSINTIEQSDLNLTTGFTYRFDTSHSSNTGYTFKFAHLPGAGINPLTSVVGPSIYTDNITFGEDANNNVISPGSMGSYTQITINDSTPSTLYYYGETGGGGALYYNQHSSGAHQKITHISLKTSLEDFNTHIDKQQASNGVFQQGIISHTPTAFRSGTALNKFLMATNASGSNAVWRDLGEGGSIKIDHIIADGVEITGTSMFDSTVNVFGNINCSQACNVHTFSASNPSTFNSNILVTGTIKTNIVHAPTSGIKTLLVKGGDANGSNVLLGTHDTYYRANKHYFYARGAKSGLSSQVGGGNNMHSSSQWGGVFFNGSPKWSSDDRLKHNEEDISDALSTIRKLNAQKYQKTDEPKEADFVGELTEDYIYETGFIAQEVMQIPELAYCVTDGETSSGKDIYYLNYNDIFVVNVQAVKELDAKVALQQEIIDGLENRLKKLENSV